MWKAEILLARLCHGIFKTNACRWIPSNQPKSATFIMCEISAAEGSKICAFRWPEDALCGMILHMISVTWYECNGLVNTMPRLEELVAKSNMTWWCFTITVC